MSKAEFWSWLEGTKVQGIDLLALAQEHGTPLYVYNGNAIHERLKAYQQSALKPKIHYAVKANSNLSLLAKMAQWGAGFDIVSLGELLRVQKAGGKARDIVFSGVGKTEEELRYALNAEISCFNVESEAELWQLAALARQMGKRARIALRVNPDVDAKTHPYISTGMKDNKFGIAIEEVQRIYQQAAQEKSLEIIGVGCHIGSQITQLSPFKEAIQSIKALADALCAQGIAIQHIDMGGGLGIQMQEEQVVPSPQQLLALYEETLAGSAYALHLQPGRSLVGNQALLLSRVLNIKQQSEKRFVIIDVAMNDYMRPALYQALPPVKNLQRTELMELSDIVGPVCETGDTLRKAIEIAAQTGDLLAIAGVGAYGMSMASRYNSRLQAAEVWIENQQAHLIRLRDCYEQLWENEIRVGMLERFSE